MEASVPKDWYMYSNDFDPELDPMVTEVLFDKNSSFELIGGLNPIGEKEK